MRFLKDWDMNNMNNSRLLQMVLSFALLYFSILWLTNILLYSHKIGFTYSSVVNYYLGSEEEFKNPVSYIGLLEGTHFHLFVYAMLLLLLNHLTIFSNLDQSIKMYLIYTSFISALLDISSGWLIRFISPYFAYVKIASFVIFQTSLLLLLICSFMAIKAYKKRP